MKWLTGSARTVLQARAGKVALAVGVITAALAVEAASPGSVSKFCGSWSNNPLRSLIP